MLFETCGFLHHPLGFTFGLKGEELSRCELTILIDETVGYKGGHSRTL